MTANLCETHVASRMCGHILKTVNFGTNFISIMLVETVANINYVAVLLSADYEQIKRAKHNQTHVPLVATSSGKSSPR